MELKNILITGGSGFIGTNLLELFNRKKHLKVTSLDKLDSKFRFKNINYVKSDLKNFEFGSKISQKIDCVIHLAAETRVVESENNPQKFYNENINKTINFFFKCKNHGVKQFIFFSTAGAISGNTTYASELSKENPLSFYGLSKQITEKLLKYFGKKYNIKITIVRLSNVYGKYSLNKSSFIHLFIKKLKKKEKLEIYGDGKQTRDFIYAEDIAKIINKIIDKKMNDTFILASGKSYSLNYVISKINSLKKNNIKIFYLKPRSTEVKKSSFNNKKILNKINLKFTNIENGLLKTVNWYKQNYF